MSNDFPVLEVKAPPMPTASEWVLQKYHKKAIDGMRRHCLAYPKVLVACWGSELPVDADEATICDAYNLLVANNKTMRDVFNASHPGRER